MTAPASTAPPGRIWYLVAIAIFLVGMAAMAAFLITRLMSMDSGLTRFVVPGEQTLTLEAGSYTIFHEPQGVIDGKIYVAGGRPPRASVVDLAPTILYFMGLPVGRDMDGFARIDLFKPAFTSDKPVTYIPSYGR